MTDITLRIPKGSPITFEEMDSNLLALDSDTPFKVSDGHVTYEGKIGVGVDSTHRPTYQIDFGSGDSNNEATIGTNDADLHVHVDGPRSLKVSTNTQERLTLTTQGNLGIGQPNPEFPLDIDGNARITGTFRGNQFRAYSFSDSADLTISNGNITNAKRIVSTGQIDFSRLYDRQTGYKVDHIDSVITLDSAASGLPTTKAVYDALESDRSSGSAALDSAIDQINQQLDSNRTQYLLNMDSEHLWNLSEHQDLQDNIDSLREETHAFFDSEHAWNVAQHNELQDNLDSEHAWNVARHDSIHASLDSEHAWNVARHDSIHASLDSEHAWNVARHDSIHASLDSEHLWNVAEHNQLQANIDSVNDELIAQGTARHDSEHAWNVDRHDSIHASLDSEHAWNVARHDSIHASLDSEHAWNVARHDSIHASLDSEHLWNVASHNQLQANLDAEAQAREDADSDLLASLNASLDSEHAWNVDRHDSIHGSLDSEHAWNIVQHNELQTNIDLLVDSLNAHIELNNSRFDSVNNNLNQLQINIDSVNLNLSNALDSLEGSVSGNLDSDITAINNKLDSAENRLDNRIDSEHAWNVAEHNILQSQFDNLTTDSVAEGDINLYYTNARVDARNDSTIDSDFLNNRMPLGNLSDVQLTTPDLNEVLQWNGSVWSNQSIGIVGTIEFRGTVDATVDAAPAGPTNGDFYINLGRGNALASWVGLSTVDSGDGLAWDSNASNWRNLGKTSSASVVRVQAGTAISVDETDTARPVVAVRKDVTDTWYYTQSQVDSDIKVEHDFNVAEHNQLQVNINAETQAREDADSDLLASVNTSLDSEHTWNIAQHNELQLNINAEAQAREDADSDLLALLNASLDSEHAWNVAEHSKLDSALNNLDSSLRLAIDSLGINIDGDLALEISNIQSQIDSINDRIDSEHAWNVTEHDNLQSSIDLLVDSLNAHIILNNNRFDSVNGNLNQLQININNLDSSVNERLDSLQSYVDNVVNINIGNLDSDLTILQEYVDSFVAVEIAKLDSALDSEHRWNVREHGKLDSALDSEHAWNVREHGKLDSALDSEHAWNVAEHYRLDSDLRMALDSLGENITAGLIISEDPPTDPSEGDLWMSTTEETVYIYDGVYWFEFPGTGNTYASLAIGDTAPNEPSQGTMWMDNTEGVVKIYDGDYWFDWPWPDIEAGDLGFLDSAATQAMIDSELNGLDAGGLDSEHVQDMIDSTIDAVHIHTFGVENVSVGTNALSDGNLSVGVGVSALEKSNSSAVWNTAVGHNAAQNNTTGTSNTAIGASALQSNVTGNSLTAIGNSARTSVDGLNNSTAIGSNAVVDASNKIQLGDPNVTLVHTHGSMQATDFLGVDAKFSGAVKSGRYDDGSTGVNIIQSGNIKLRAGTGEGSTAALIECRANTDTVVAEIRSNGDFVSKGNATFTGTVTANKIDGGTY